MLSFYYPVVCTVFIMLGEKECIKCSSPGAYNIYVTRNEIGAVGSGFLACFINNEYTLALMIRVCYSNHFFLLVIRV